MHLEYAKEELIKRYKYLSENAEFILAPFMYMQSTREFEETKLMYNIKEPLIFLNLDIKNTAMMNIFEEFLLTNENIDTTVLYKSIERNKSDIDFLKKYQNGLILYKKINDSNLAQKIKLDISTILYLTIIYVNEQSGDLKNKENKIKVLNEYMNLFKYQNDYLNNCEVEPTIISSSKTKPSRNKCDIGLKENEFIAAISSAKSNYYNDSIFTEKEKQEVYLELHDELPWDLEIECSSNQKDIRPNFSCPCHQKFYIKENEIFMKPREFNPIKFYDKYYAACPRCGFIVELPKDIITPGMKKKIEEKCLNDIYLYRKMWLYSELFALENIGPKNQKKLILK